MQNEALTSAQYRELHLAAVKEDDVQAEIVDYCRKVLPRPWQVFAVPNKSPRGKSGKALNGCPGFRRGVSDLILTGPNRTAIFAEIKRPKTACHPAGKLRLEQVAFLDAMRACEFVGCIWYGVEDARNTFLALGVLKQEGA